MFAERAVLMPDETKLVPAQAWGCARNRMRFKGIGTWSGEQKKISQYLDQGIENALWSSARIQDAPITNRDGWLV
jgi:hypothetical protein